MLQVTRGRCDYLAMPPNSQTINRRVFGVASGKTITRVCCSVCPYVQVKPTLHALRMASLFGTCGINSRHQLFQLPSLGPDFHVSKYFVRSGQSKCLTHLSWKACSSMTGMRSKASFFTTSHCGERRFRYSHDLLDRGNETGRVCFRHDGEESAARSRTSMRKRRDEPAAVVTQGSDIK